MALGCYAGTRAVVAAVGVIVQRHAILAVVLLGCSGCLRRRLYRIAGRLHCSKRRSVVGGCVGGWRVQVVETKAALGELDDEYRAASQRQRQRIAVWSPQSLYRGESTTRCR
jgi:hypothetical protein